MEFQKITSLGKVLSRESMKQIIGGNVEEEPQDGIGNPVCAIVNCSATCIARARCGGDCINYGTGASCNGNYYTNVEICRAIGC